MTGRGGFWVGVLSAAWVSAFAPVSGAQAPDWGQSERHAYVFQAAQRGSLRAVAFGVDGSVVAIATSTGYVSLLDAHAGTVLATRRLESTSSLDVRSLAVEPHGRVVTLAGLSETSGGFVRSWAPGTDVVREIGAETYYGGGVGVSPDGARLAYHSDDALLLVRAADSRTLATVPHGSGGRLTWPDRAGLVVHDPRAHTVEIVEPAHLTSRATLTDVLAIAIDAPRHRVLCRTGDAIVALDLRTGREALRIPRPLATTATSPELIVSTDGSRVALVDEPSASTIVALDGRAEERVLPGAVLWLSRTRAVVRALDGSIGRHVVATGSRSGWVSRTPLDASALFLGPDGTAIFERNAHLEMSAPDGTRSSISTEGEHSVWWASTDGAHLAVGGRFGLDLWDAAGVHDLGGCTGSTTHAFDASGALVAGATECQLSSGRERPHGSAGPAVSDSGVVTGTDLGRVTLRGARRECDLEFGGCDPDLQIAAGGRYVVMTSDGQFTDDPSESRIFEVASGRVSVSLPPQETVVVDPEGRWAAAISQEHVELVLLPSGAELAHLGTSPEERDEPSTAPFAVSGDGTRLAVLHQGSVRVLEAASGRNLATIPAAGVQQIVLSRNGTTIALQAGRSVRTGTITSPLVAAADLQGSAGLDGVFCSEGHAFVLDRSGPGLPRRDLGVCWEGARLDGEGRYLLATSEGVVRVRRLSTGTELTFRSIRGERYDEEGTPLPDRGTVHFAHDATGHYWSDSAADVAVPVRVRDAAGALQPLDPALADPHLLASFFGGTS